jgi:3-hydroxybutyryl-CoA dehydratase
MGERKPMEAEGTQLFLEDFHAGAKFAGASRKITEADVLSFASLTGDRHPIHYDDEYAKKSRFGRPIVHGLHLVALTALGATPLADQLKRSMIALVEQHAAFRSPVFKDDTVRSEFEVDGVEARPDKSFGKLKMKVKLINQRDETVLEGWHVYRIACRAGAKAAGKS